MRLSQRLLEGVLLVALLALGIAGCRDREDPDICEVFCAEAAHCHQLEEQWFSESRCDEDCHEQWEGYRLIDCGEAFVELKECEEGLSCSEWGNYSMRCDYEVELLKSCIQ